MACLLFGNPGRAATVYDNGSPNFSRAVPYDPCLVADDFTLSTARTLAGLTVWVAPALGSGTFAQAFSGTISWGNVVLPQGIYWLAVHEGAWGSAIDNSPIWGIGTDGGNVRTIRRTTDQSGSMGWSSAGDSGVELAFQIRDDSVPDPSSVVFLSMGLAAIGWMRRSLRR